MNLIPTVQQIKIKYLIILLLIVSSCQSQSSKLDKLELENRVLKGKIAKLEKQNSNVVTKLNNQVTLANTTVKEIKSKFNNQNYQIKISYPKSYFKNTTKKYPVLYVIDAETNFGGVSYIVQRLIKDQLIPEILVVGIAYNTNYKEFYSLRSRDLTPVEDKKLKMGNHKIDPTGGAPKFSNFLEYELFPFIDKNYRTKKKDRAIYGHSYGGLFGSYVLLNKSHLFNRYLLLGPSLWFKDKLLVKNAKDKFLVIDKPTRFYMSSGKLDLRIEEYQEEFTSFLKEKEIDNLRVKSEVIENETHRTIFGVGFTNGLRFIYNK